MLTDSDGGQIEDMFGSCCVISGWRTPGACPRRPVRRWRRRRTGTTFQRSVQTLPGNIQPQLHASSTLRRIAWTCALWQSSSPGQWPCQEQETKHVSSGWRVTCAAVCPMEPAPGQDGHGHLDCRRGLDNMQGISSVEFGKHPTSRPSPHRCMESVHPRVALSLGEAESYASVRGATETVRFMSTMRELRDSSLGQITHRVDAGAFRAIILRHGCGGRKHITGRTFFCGEYHKFLARVFSTSFYRDVE